MSKIAILGFGLEGRATYDFLCSRIPGVEIHIFDDNPEVKVPEEAIFYYGHTIPADFDVVYKTPGIPTHKMVLENPKTKVSSLTNLFLENITGQVIGVTGSKGKSTTSSLIYHILLAAGKKSVLVGNIGTAALLKLSEDSPETWYVYEISSYQCEHLDRSPHIAVITNLYQDHLDHHGGVTSYHEAKKRLTKFQTEKDFLIVPKNIDIPTCAQKVFVEKPHAYFDTSLIGEHNQMNIAFALATAALVGVSEYDVLAAIKTFKPLEYRLEKVGEFRGITFYDDSLATIPEATLEALKALPEVDTLILGGQDRGISLAGFPEALAKSQITTFITFPENGLKMVEGISGKNILSAQTMEEAVRLAYQNAKHAVLLSNASPSYNMFKDYKDKSAQYRYWISQWTSK